MRFLSRGSFADALEDDREGVSCGRGDDAFSPRVGYATPRVDVNKSSTEQSRNWTDIFYFIF